MLLDMHIGDWHPGFLAHYDPSAMADLYAHASVNAVMFYTQSHVGLCYWPTRSGKMHAGLKGHDLIGLMLKELKARDISACGYYSLIYNNWAYREHPEWRILPAADISDGSFAGYRYGHCCPNNPGYVDFVMEQINELSESYEFDSLFFDMTFWPAICLCPHCRQRYRQETGEEIPETIDWFSPAWCRFQADRERWIDTFAGRITSRVKSLKPGMTVYHNFATAAFNWTLGLPLSSSINSDFLGADFYGDSLEQLISCKIMSNLSRNKPVEFMTSCCVNLRDHVTLKPPEILCRQVLASTIFSAASLLIDAVDPDGQANPALYEQIRDIYAQAAVFEPYLGGEPVEEIAVYFSDASKVNFTENGQDLAQAPMWRHDYPHYAALRGACSHLQQAHLPFGVITRKQLETLGSYKLIILPDVLRMDQEEAQAFRHYVNQGGSLYASGNTSLTDINGVSHDDFMLADVFGCSYAGKEDGKIVYAKAANDKLRQVLQPQKYLNISSPSGIPVPRIRSKPGATVLASLTLPYAYPEDGDVNDLQWASIHSSPPWEDTDHPVMLYNSYGKGRAVYSASVVEQAEDAASARVFREVVHLLYHGNAVYVAEAPVSTWVNVSHQPDKNRFLIGFLHHHEEGSSACKERVELRLRPMPGRAYTRLLLLPEERPLPFTTDESGCLSVVLEEPGIINMLLAVYT